MNRENISLLDELGRGQFGTVMEGSAVNLPNSNGRTTRVAVKFLKETITDNERKIFMKEAINASRLDHDNVLKLLAVCFDSEPCFLVFEFMSNGDLKTYLRMCENFHQIRTMTSSTSLSSPDVPLLTTVHMLKFARDASCGLAYLSSLKFVHRDIAARNVLLDHNFVAKLGDFGMARQLYQSEV